MSSATDSTALRPSSRECNGFNSLEPLASIESPAIQALGWLRRSNLKGSKTFDRLTHIQAAHTYVSGRFLPRTTARPRQIGGDCDAWPLAGIELIRVVSPFHLSHLPRSPHTVSTTADSHTSGRLSSAANERTMAHVKSKGLDAALEDCEEPECRNPSNILSRVLAATMNGGRLWSRSIWLVDWCVDPSNPSTMQARCRRRRKPTSCARPSWTPGGSPTARSTRTRWAAEPGDW